MTCPTCGRPGYSGCGAHVEQVLGDVPRAERCACNGPGAATRGGSMFSRLFGR
ncbi:MAG: hypothetical protein V9E89_07050 [Ilumatobacteraceae bacterium]